MKLIPYVHFAGNAEEAINFYAKALNAEVVTVQRYGDSPVDADEDYKQKIMHARIKIGDDILMISDVFKGQPVSTNGNVDLSVDVESAERIETIFKNMAEGGKVVMPLEKQFWGAIFGMVEDKFGVKWMFNHELEKQ